MAKSNQELSERISDKNGQMAPLSIKSKLDDWSKRYLPELVRLAGDEKEAQKIFTICLNTISRNPKLIECDFSTLANCIMQSFQLKLFPGPFQHCAFVPLKNGKTGKTEANWWPQYQGLNELMLRAGNKIVIAHVIREGDHFEYREGREAPVYAPAVVMGKKRGKALFTYAAVCTRGGFWRVEVMDEEQMLTLMNRSKAVQNARKYGGGDSPWLSKFDDDVDAMRCKSVVKRVSKWVSKSADLITALELDDEVDGDDKFNRFKVVDLANSEPIDEVRPETKALAEPAQTATFATAVDVDLATGNIVFTDEDLGLETTVRPGSL